MRSSSCSMLAIAVGVFEVPAAARAPRAAVRAAAAFLQLRGRRDPVLAPPGLHARREVPAAHRVARQTTLPAGAARPGLLYMGTR